MTHADLIATVGRTPLVELRRLAKDLPGRVLAKLEMRNACRNVKDRVAVALVQGMTIVEATGGNTGIGLLSSAQFEAIDSS
jgi:cysteine synthase A